MHALPTLVAPLAVAYLATDLGTVLDSLRNWLTGLLVAIATLMLVWGGVRYMLAAGNPHSLEQAKESIRSALIGFALAGLAPVLVDIARRVLGL
jgi:hypothetical protein